jgi:site-specific DNA-methyltransferase (adenine-specific)
MPEKELDRIIRACSNPGETVLDPFGGSGTTLVVAKKLHRKFVGFELSPGYAKRIHERLKVTKPGDPIIDASTTSTMKAPPTSKGKRRRDVAAQAPLIPFPTQSPVRSSVDDEARATG